MYSLEFVMSEKRKDIPKHELKKVYDSDDNVLFGSRYVKGKVSYNYIPAELMETGNPFIINSSINYDGEGNKNLPADAIVKSFSELPAMFPDNKFKP